VLPYGDLLSVLGIGISYGLATCLLMFSGMPLPLLWELFGSIRLAINGFHIYCRPAIAGYTAIAEMFPFSTERNGLGGHTLLSDHVFISSAHACRISAQIYRARPQAISFFYFAAALNACGHLPSVHGHLAIAVAIRIFLALRDVPARTMAWLLPEPRRLL